MPELLVEHFRTHSGRDPVQDFLDKLPRQTRDVCQAALRRLATGEAANRARSTAHLVDDIWELRVSFDGNAFRFTYCVNNGTATVLSAFKKKQQQTPDKAIDVARQRRKQL